MPRRPQEHPEGATYQLLAKDHPIVRALELNRLMGGHVPLRPAGLEGIRLLPHELGLLVHSRLLFLCLL
mgnify:CR=1 FL=1